MARIAIIGSGISGMGAAYLLHPHHTVTLYEKNAVIGGHTRTKLADFGDVQIPVDTGFIVFNDRNYPHLTGLFSTLDVPVIKSDMSFAMTLDRGRFEWGAKDFNAVFGQRRNFFKPPFHRLLREVLRFNREAPGRVAVSPQMTLGELAAAMKLSDRFLRHYILPMGGAIWSAPPSLILGFPARTFVQFFENHGLLSLEGQPQWYTVAGGSREYVVRLTAPFAAQIRTGCAAVKVTRENGLVQVTDGRGETYEYDRIILASHADESLALLADATAEERRILGAFTFQKNHAVLHRDPSFMPKRKRCWASWVYHCEGAAGDELSIGVTYWMNLLQSIDAKYPLFVTLNPGREIAPENVFDRHDFEHPVFTHAAIAAQAEIPGLQGVQNTWFCGAWQRHGFHEDGLASAVNVAQQMGANIPWL